jgi:hypothetical protein
MAAPQKRSPRGTEVQSLLFDKRYFTAREARTWAAQNGFRAPATDATKNHYQLRQRDPRRFKKGTFRTITLTPGVQARIAVPNSASSGTKRTSSKKTGVKGTLSRWFLEEKKKPKKRRKKKR